MYILFYLGFAAFFFYIKQTYKTNQYMKGKDHWHLSVLELQVPTSSPGDPYFPAAKPQYC